jgi:DNA-binding MarR family transcriptional regulator
MAPNHAPYLRFNGSLWCNLDIALRNVDQIFRQMIRPIGLTVIEWYILRALYERDGQHASELARTVGRAATSFTPNLDKLQKKGFIERRADQADRRAVRIYLTDSAQQYRSDVIHSAGQIDEYMQQLFSTADFERFQAVLAVLQTSEPTMNVMKR